MTEAEKKAKWLEALRSGTYNQTKGTLYGAQSRYDQLGYCCLGVYAKEILEEKLEPCYMQSDGKLDEGPDEIYDKIREEIPECIVESGISMNDRGMSFSDIAEMIEQEWKV